MRTTFITLIFFMALQISKNSHAQETPLFCSKNYGVEIYPKIKNLKISDKAQHCSLSCLVARKCQTMNILFLGFFKEMVDIVGPGNSEIADMQANFLGTYFAFNSKQSCLYLCTREYLK